MHGHPAVMLQRFGARGLGVIADKWHLPDFESLRGGEESHVDGVVVNGVDQAAFFEDAVVYSGFLLFRRPFRWARRR